MKRGQQLVNLVHHSRTHCSLDLNEKRTATDATTWLNTFIPSVRPQWKEDSNLSRSTISITESSVRPQWKEDSNSYHLLTLFHLFRLDLNEKRTATCSSSVLWSSHHLGLDLNEKRTATNISSRFISSLMLVRPQWKEDSNLEGHHLYRSSYKVRPQWKEDSNCSRSACIWTTL